jgi:hypothetical protein
LHFGDVQATNAGLPTECTHTHLLAHPGRSRLARLDAGTQFAGLVQFAQEQRAAPSALCLAVVFFLVSSLFAVVRHGESPLLC